MAPASCYYYEKVRRTNALLKYLYSFSATELNKNESEDEVLAQEFSYEKRVIMEIAMMKIFNNCIAGRLNNNYFPLNESSSSY